MRQALTAALLFFHSILCSAQTSEYNYLKDIYDDYRSKKLNDSALLIAKKINYWALKNENDTSLRFAISFRYIANCFKSLEISDSAIFYYKYS